MSVSELVRDRFVIGWVRDGAVTQEPAEGWPWSGDSGIPAIICPRCVEPAWAVTRHCVERHGDSDVEILPPHPNAKRPEWFQPDWI